MSNLEKIVGPYCYPLYVDNAEEIRKELVKEKVFIPTLWPNVIEQGKKIETDFATNILPLPCDQRYNLDDMKALEKIIKKLLNI